VPGWRGGLDHRRRGRGHTGAVQALLPLASLPLASLPLASLPLASLPLASLPLASLPLASLPLAWSGAVGRGRRWLG
jgi:hypothetical protein